MLRKGRAVPLVVFVEPESDAAWLDGSAGSSLDTDGLRDEGLETDTQNLSVTIESTVPEHRHIHGEDEIRRLLCRSEKIDDPVVAQLNIFAHDFLEGRDVSILSREWIDLIAASYPLSQPQKRRKKHGRRRKRRQRDCVRRTPSRIQLWRLEYAKV